MSFILGYRRFLLCVEKCLGRSDHFSFCWRGSQFELGSQGTNISTPWHNLSSGKEWPGTFFIREYLFYKEIVRFSAWHWGRRKLAFCTLNFMTSCMLLTVPFPSPPPVSFCWEGGGVWHWFRAQELWIGVQMGHKLYRTSNFCKNFDSRTLWSMYNQTLSAFIQYVIVVRSLTWIAAHDKSVISSW